MKTKELKFVNIPYVFHPGAILSKYQIPLQQTLTIMTKIYINIIYIYTLWHLDFRKHSAHHVKVSSILLYPNKFWEKQKEKGQIVQICSLFLLIPFLHIFNDQGSKEQP